MGDWKSGPAARPTTRSSTPSHGTIRIGPDTLFSHDCHVLTGTHQFWQGAAPAVRGFADPEVPTEGRDIIIGSGCFFGAAAIVMGPVTIGDNVVIAAGAVLRETSRVGPLRREYGKVPEPGGAVAPALAWLPPVGLGYTRGVGLHPWGWATPVGLGNTRGVGQHPWGWATPVGLGCCTRGTWITPASAWTRARPAPPAPPAWTAPEP